VTESVAAILLGGWAAEPPGGRDHGFGDGVLDLFAEASTLAERWQQHEPYLRALARTWCVEPGWYVEPRNEYGLRFVVSERGKRNDGPYYYAEALALAGPQRV
jgi:hypothetical protein